MRIAERLGGDLGGDAQRERFDGSHWRESVQRTTPTRASPDEPALEVHVRAKHFGVRRVLQDVHIRLAPGELTCLVGASGCGKSTLLRIAAGLDPAFDGSVRVDGRTQAGPSRNVGVVFQEPRLFPWCTVADNVAFESGGARPDDAHVANLLDEVGLRAHAAALPRQLSGGQAQRAALARALASRPRVLLLDEPFSAVDAFTRMRLQDVLAELVRRSGVAALLVTHDIDEAAYLSDRVLVLDADPGRLRQVIAVRLDRLRDRADPKLAEARVSILRALREAHAL